MRGGDLFKRHQQSILAQLGDRRSYEGLPSKPTLSAAKRRAKRKAERQRKKR